MGEQKKQKEEMNNKAQTMNLIPRWSIPNENKKEEKHELPESLHSSITYDYNYDRLNLEMHMHNWNLNFILAFPFLNIYLFILISPQLVLFEPLFLLIVHF